MMIQRKHLRNLEELAVYSNNESNVSSSLTIFETLWIQSEIDKQNKIKDAYFQIFKGFQLKDEVYSRQWSFEQYGQEEKSNFKQD